MVDLRWKSGGNNTLQSAMHMKSLKLLAFTLVLYMGLVPFRLGGDTRRIDGVILTSMIRLLAHPERYQGKEIHVMGYYTSGFEYSGLFLTKDDAELGNAEHAIWITREGLEESNEKIIGITNGYASVVGTFHYRENDGVGHMNGWPAELREIKEFLPQERRTINDDKPD